MTAEAQIRGWCLVARFSNPQRPPSWPASARCNGAPLSETKVKAGLAARFSAPSYARDHPPSGLPGGRVGVPQTPCLLAPADDRNALATTAGGLFWPCAYCTLAATPARSISLAR